MPAPTASRDSTAPRDTGAARRRALSAADTIKAPLATPYEPLVVGARGEPMHWDRAALFSMGTLTLAELLARVPGVTLMTSGFLLAPAAAAWHGDPGGIRVFIDGIERDEITPRNGGVTDFSLVPLWSLEDVTIEETSGELRVHARTWRVDRTTASTRTDVLTGSDNLNLFRGFFGKRASNGLAVQLAAQQASTVEPLAGMDGDALGAFARLGWAAGSWSVDGSWLRQGLDRNAGTRYLLASPQTGAMPPYKGSTAMAYLRLAWRSPDSSGVWSQLIASTQGALLTPQTTTSGSAPAQHDSVNADTSASQGAYTAMLGVNRRWLRLAGGARLRTRDGATEVAPLMRLDLDRSRVGLGASVERRYAGSSVWDVRARAEPFDWIRLSASVGASLSSGSTRTRSGSSADVALGLRGRWIGAGVVRIGEGSVLPPLELDTAQGVVALPMATGLKFFVGGPLARGWNIRTDVVSWSAAAAFRPQTEAQTRIWFESQFLEFAPRGNFHLIAALTHEYRSAFFAPVGADAVGQSTPAFSSFGTSVQVRLGTAIIYWDFRNMAGHNHETFPGYLMPRSLSVYGIRWEFWN